MKAIAVILIALTSLVISIVAISRGDEGTPAGARVDVVPESEIPTSTTVTGDLTVTNLSNGGLLYSTSSGKLSQEVGQLYWDEANNRLGVGTSTPSATLHVSGTAVIGTLNGVLKGTAGTVGTATAGTDYQLPYWILSGSNLYASTTGWKVGIGTSTPAVTLQVSNGNSTTSVAVGSADLGARKGKFCLWNGSQFTVLTFAAGSTTPSYATSTACDEN